jgi:ribosomal protein S18 acetylase RimI-like enzyme
MHIKSLGYRTDLFFPKFEGEIHDRGDYLVVLTPTNPGFHWGNYLLFSSPPSKGDFERWKDLFTREINSRQETHHMVFGWDTVHGETGEAQPFLTAGFQLSQNLVMTARQIVLPPKYNHEVDIRPLSTDWEWQQALENQVTCRDAGFGLADYTVFKQAKMKRYRQMSVAGQGEWFGAFHQGRLVADLGLFCEEGVARFQSVETLPDFRRQGICGTLVYQAACHGFERMGAKVLVMIADENYFAARIYETLGFRPEERQSGLAWWAEGKA